MSHSSFFKQLALLSVGMAVVLFLFQFISPLKDTQILSWTSLIFFEILSIGMFYAGHSAAMSENKHNFTSVVIGSMMGKMFFSVVIILGYNHLMKPETKWFLLPFFLIYFVFTIFETYFMRKLGKMEPAVAES